MSSEAITRFACFGGTCAVLVTSAGPAGRAPEAVARARRRLLEWHAQFSRFDPGSELSALNGDPRPTVPVSATMARFAQAAVAAARLTGGLVDPTLAGELVAAGYAVSRAAPGAPAALALADVLHAAPPRARGRARADARWAEIEVDVRHRTVTRPPGVTLDSGGIAKGLFGDILATALAGHESFAVDAAGDVRFGGRGAAPRPVQVADPFARDGEILHTFHLVAGAAATSGIGRRAWLDDCSDPPRPAHHLIDPATGRPAFTGLVQATALAPTAVEAEARAKAALLSGPEHAAGWLIHGGLTVAEDGSQRVVAPTLAGAPETVAA